MELAAGKDIAHEEHTYDEALEMSETLPAVNVRNRSILHRGQANVKNTHLYDDLRDPQLNGFKRNVTRWLKCVMLVVNTAVMISCIVFLGIREGTKTNGGWSGWSVWTDCSATCDTGVQTRQRQCNNPVASSEGLFCEGSSMDVVHCNKQHCPRAKSSFTARNATRQSTGILSFGWILLNEGSNFDGNKGTFTCQHSGLYFFTATVVEGGFLENDIDCYITHNGSGKGYLKYRNAKDSSTKLTKDGYGTATGSSTLHLTRGDRINISCGQTTSSVISSSFTGFLIVEDP